MLAHLPVSETPLEGHAPSCLRRDSDGIRHSTAQVRSPNRLFSDCAPVRITPAAGRKLAEAAVDYARKLGFAPGADYKKGCRVFGGISTAECDEQFVLGKDGKPFYIQGPGETAERAERILRVLEARCGRDGYRYIVAAEEPGLPESTWDDNDGNVEPDDSAALQAMAARMQADRPDLKIEINPPGRSKVSDMIALVAEPLLAEAPDYETKRGILMLAGLAWNFSLFDRSKQRALINDLAGLFPDAESAELFSYLAARATMLFPDEKRIICAIETDPEASGNFALRVSSAM